MIQIYNPKLFAHLKKEASNNATFASSATPLSAPTATALESLLKPLGVPYATPLGAPSATSLGAPSAIPLLLGSGCSFCYDPRRPFFYTP